MHSISGRLRCLVFGDRLLVNGLTPWRFSFLQIYALYFPSYIHSVGYPLSCLALLAYILQQRSTDCFDCRSFTDICRRIGCHSFVSRRFTTFEAFHLTSFDSANGFWMSVGGYVSPFAFEETTCRLNSSG